MSADLHHAAMNEERLPALVGIATVPSIVLLVADTERGVGAQASGGT